MNTFTSRAVGIGVGVATVAAVALGVGTAATAATPTPSASASSATASTGVPFRAISAHAIRAQYGSVPSALATDLKALTGKAGDDRRRAVEAIEQKALAGTYGATVKTAATEARDAWKAAPAAMRHDLRAARKASRDDRGKALAAVAAKALGGTYGSVEQHYARGVEDRIQKQEAATLSGRVGAIL